MTETRDFERRFASNSGSLELNAATHFEVARRLDGYLKSRLAGPP
jgi:hypothetical protein